MYMACRHVKANGTRCKSPALKDHVFCYYHAKHHSMTRSPSYEEIRLPPPENAAAILLSISRISDALLNNRIEPRCAAQLFWGLKIASRYVQPEPETAAPEDCVESVIPISDHDELAPMLCIHGEDEDCSKCLFVNGCPNRKRADKSDQSEDLAEIREMLPGQLSNAEPAAVSSSDPQKSVDPATGEIGLEKPYESVVGRTNQVLDEKGLYDQAIRYITAINPRTRKGLDMLLRYYSLTEDDLPESLRLSINPSIRPVISPSRAPQPLSP